MGGFRAGWQRTLVGLTSLAAAVLLAGCSNGPSAAGGGAQGDTTVKPAGLGAAESARQLQPLWSQRSWLAWPDSNSNGGVSLGSDSWVAHLTSPQPRGVTTPPSLLVGHDARTGVQTWSVTLPQNTWVCALAPSHVGLPVVGVVLGGPSGCVTVAGISADTGTTVWSRTVSTEVPGIRMAAGAIAVGDPGTLGHRGGPSSCFDPTDGSPLPATSSACEAATADPRLVRADGTAVVPNDYRELASHGGVTIGWLSTESESQLFAFSMESGKQLWQRARAKTGANNTLDTVFADGRGLIHVVPDGTHLTLTRVDGRSLAATEVVGTVQADGFLGIAGDIAIFATAGDNPVNGTLSGFKLD